MSKKSGVLLVGIVYISMVCGMLIGCGTKGPLYIPEQRYPQAATNKPNGEPKVENKIDKSSSDTQHTSQ